jgi:hypothetical protein
MKKEKTKPDKKSEFYKDIVKNNDTFRLKPQSLERKINKLSKKQSMIDKFKQSYEIDLSTVYLKKEDE